MKNNYGFLKGALIGGVVAGVAGLLLAPKPGAELLDDILDTYNYAQRNGNDFLSALKKKGASIAHLHSEEKSENHSSFLIGGAIGAVVVGIATLLIAPSSGKKLRKLLGKQYGEFLDKATDFVTTVAEKGENVFDEVHDWKDTFINLINQLSQVPKGKNQHSKIDDIVDLAHTGLRLYQQLQRR